jgi:succinoglycan biosynthesis protein ExoW
MDTPILSVVIPFFQRERGILPRAVRTALAQTGIDNFDIIVVDDGSPVPAKEELVGLVESSSCNVRIIEQVNRGVGGARNTGLSAIPKNRKYVAFLDSDDEWDPLHLSTAVKVLAQGFDFYFSNLFHRGKNVSTFDLEMEISHPSRFRSDEMKEVPNLEKCYAYVGDMFDRVLFSGNRIITSTIVYRYDKFPTIRFPEDVRNMGEDYLFYATLAKAGASFAFSWVPRVRRGDGINLFDKSGLGSPQFLSRLCDELRFRKCAASTWTLTDAQRAQSRKQINSVRRNFAIAFANHLRRGEFEQVRYLVRFLTMDPLFPFVFPYFLVSRPRTVRPKRM